MNFAILPVVLDQSGDGGELRAPYSQEIMDEFNRDCNLVVLWLDRKLVKLRLL